jgi:hypothetical protein
MFIEVGVHYAQGTHPATDVQIWVRRLPRNEGDGIYGGWVGYLTTGDTIELKLTRTIVEQGRLPFPEFLDREPDPDEFFVGLLWKRPDGQIDQLKQRQWLTGRPVEPFSRS